MAVSRAISARTSSSSFSSLKTSRCVSRASRRSRIACACRSVSSNRLAQPVARFGGGLARLDDAYHLVDVAHRDDEAFQDVLALLLLFQLEFGALQYDLPLVIHVVRQDVQKTHLLRLAVGDGHHVDAERNGQIGMLEQHVEDRLGIAVALDLDDGAHAVAV